jgi:menaquinone-dependent protoporphyrinogen oxidase
MQTGGVPMPAPILIAYATRGGSTSEVAEAVAVVFDEAGLAADELPVSGVDSLAGREVLILGAPLYMGNFPKEFHQFLRRHREALGRLQPWCFVLGPTRREAKDFEAARRQATRQLDRYRWLRPADVQIFGGRWNMNSLPFPFSLLRRIPGNPLAKIPAEDIRDWAAVKQWATGIAAQIQPAGVVR